MTDAASSSELSSPDLQWYKDAIIYEVHARAFCDSDADGFGDFRGLASKLDYLIDLGVTALWLLPFYPSPLKDGGYDIADYYGVHPQYGTLRDFKAFLEEAHRRGLRVITELVINHTSDQHPWFQRARRASPGSRWRDFYVWSDTPDRYAEARIIFQDFEASNWSWDPVAKAYYWHRFYAHQPDLNFDNPEVRREILKVMDFWLGLGVDGLRLDAVPYLYEREGTNCENLPETHAFLKELRRHVDARFPGRMLLAEANQWPEDAVAYFGEGDECHMAFHFPLMPRLFKALSSEDRFPMEDILAQTPAIPPSCQWGLFLRNHDELTLEMVTDEDRDYMVRTYALDPHARINLGIRRRLAPLLQNDRRKIELMNVLLFSFPGTPVLYYGDELGMGDNIYLGDRDGVRTPMQWSADRNAGFSSAPAQQLYLPLIVDPAYHFLAVNVEAARTNPSSVWWWMRRAIALRRAHPALSRGSLEFLHPSSQPVLALLRRSEGETILVVANLSRHAQQARLELSGLAGYVPLELFGQTAMAPIGAEPYQLTLGPYGYFWFALEPSSDMARLTVAHEQVPPSAVACPEVEDWTDLFEEAHRRRVEAAIPPFLGRSRWFGGKDRTIRDAVMRDTACLTGRGKNERAVLCFVDVFYEESPPETYFLPLAFEEEEAARERLKEHPEAVLCTVSLGRRGRRGILYDAIHSGHFPPLLLRLLRRGRELETEHGALRVAKVPAVAQELLAPLREPAARVLQAEQSNSSLVFGESLILKLYRKIEEGEHPEVAMGRHLTEKVRFPFAPRMAASLSYNDRKRNDFALGILHEFIPSQGDGWAYTQGPLGRFFERVLSQPDFSQGPPASVVDARGVFLRSQEPTPLLLLDLMGRYADLARLLGEITAGMHRALVRWEGNPSFEPQPFTSLYQRGICQAIVTLLHANLGLLAKKQAELSQRPAQLARSVAPLQRGIEERLARLTRRRLSAWRSRYHGDFHLGQVLYTGRDFSIVDFEGEPARSLADRRLLRSPVRDVAGMIRSFQYAAYFAIKTQLARGILQERQRDIAEAWADVWVRTAAQEYLRSYWSAVRESPYLASPPEDFRVLLESFLLEKAIYEVGYELSNRPEWVDIPLTGILRMMQHPE
ncbi:MAG: maltose alpha-D-glucosyltransferase [Acidobacteriota bacterium]